MIVKTNYGEVEGVCENGMIAFKGIPFAKAPVGNLRFKAPVPVEPWEGVLNAKYFGNRSLQTDEQEYKDKIPFSENCLNLNIWMPEKVEKKAPVIFYIHGGGHFSGANSDEFFDGPHLVKDRNAIMVAPNYRLGVLGYLYLGDILGDEYKDSGNCGLLDQILALKWVKENIEYFGGDAENITLMGQSAGAKSVSNIMVTPKAKGMFNKIIVQSGATQCIRDLNTATKIAEIVLDELGLNADTAEEILNIDSERIIEAQKAAYKRINMGHLFGPVLDGRTILERPEDYIKAGKVGKIKALIGYNNNELYYSDPKKDKSDEEILNSLKTTYGLNWEIAYDRYLEFCERESKAMAFDHVQTECVYGNATLRLTQLLADNGIETWSYRWDFEGNQIPIHFSEMAYIFDYSKEESYKGYDKADRAYAMLMNETWMSFIINGDPENVLLPCWAPCTNGEKGYRMYFDKKPRLEEYMLDSYNEKFPMQVIRL